jgi:hypothetical protein
MLDAERGTRGAPRVAIRDRQLLSDWRGTIARLARRLYVPLDTAPRAAARSSGDRAVLAP